MKGFNYGVLLVIIALLVAGCVAGSNEGADANITMEQLANMEYQSEFTKSGTALLKDGEYSEEAAPGSATQTSVMLTDLVAFGELNGEPAAAVVLVTDPGGSGTFYTLHVVVNQDGELVDIASTDLGDRVQINSLAIEDGQRIVDMVTHGPDDPMCCPTQEVVKKYELQNELVEVPN
jgi:Na+-translocating ferredoxin:NAD+ oxidoreductase RnfG subunit